MQAVTTEVAIIGAGPAGTYLANRLTRLGVPFVLIERRSRAGVRARERAGLLERRVVDLLTGHGLADGLLAHGKPHGGAVFRTPHAQIELDMAAHCEGKTRLVYPQNLLVEDLIEQAVGLGADLRFEHEALRIETATATETETEAERETLVCRSLGGHELRIHARYVVAADGHAGLGRRVVSERGASFQRYRFPHDWLAIMATVRPSAPHAIYGIHPRGFAGHMIRTDSVTRFYLQIEAGEGPGAWPDDRIWAELERRLAAPGWRLERGEISSTRLLELRSEIVDSMVHGRVLLVGDAAHLMPPCGGKGMNLAFMDAEALAGALSACVLDGHDPARLLAWSQARLDDTWVTFQFTHMMTELLHNEELEPDNARFAALLKTRWLTHLARDPHAGPEFSRRYIGL